MINSERKFDWFSLVIGILWVILGAAAINSPSTAISVIAVFVGIGALAKGIYTLWLRRAIQMLTGSNSKMTLLIISSVVDIILGITFLFRIHFGFGIIAYLFAFWFIFDSILQLVIDHFFKAMNRSYFDILVVLNIITLILGVVLLFNPMLSIYTLIGVVAFYLFLIGITKIIQAF